MNDGWNRGLNRWLFRKRVQLIPAIVHAKVAKDTRSPFAETTFRVVGTTLVSGPVRLPDDMSGVVSRLVIEFLGVKFIGGVPTLDPATACIQYEDRFEFPALLVDLNGAKVTR